MFLAGILGKKARKRKPPREGRLEFREETPDEALGHRHRTAGMVLVGTGSRKYAARPRRGGSQRTLLACEHCSAVRIFLTRGTERPDWRRDRSSSILIHAFNVEMYS
jgi:hypothetical protein